MLFINESSDAEVSDQEANRRFRANAKRAIEILLLAMRAHGIPTDAENKSQLMFLV